VRLVQLVLVSSGYFRLGQMRSRLAKLGHDRSGYVSLGLVMSC
jgi:hypothetical protein